jgi:hypothetical protein
MLIVRDRRENLKCLGIPEGKFVKVFSGDRNFNGVIGHTDSSLSGFESFLIYDSRPDVD